jgi:hypothetical protein
MQIDDSLYEPLNRKAATLLLVVATLLMFLSEANIIHGLWLGTVARDYGYKRFTVPFIVLAPLILAIAVRIGSKRILAAGRLSPAASARFDLFFGCFLMITYTCILELAELAF